MKLIPPPRTEITTTPDPVVVSEAKSKLNALALLNSTGEDFAEALARAVKRVTKQDRVPSALALMAFLRGGISMLQSISRDDADAFYIDAQDEQEGTNGHTTSHRAAGRRSGTTGRNKSRKAAGRTTNAAATDDTGDAPVKRGRGRPKGSKNKKTLKREAHLQSIADQRIAAERIARNAQARKRRAVKRKAKAVNKSIVGKSGNSRNRRAAGGRKGAAKKVGRKR